MVSREEIESSLPFGTHSFWDWGVCHFHHPDIYFLLVGTSEIESPTLGLRIPCSNLLSYVPLNWRKVGESNSRALSGRPLSRRGLRSCQSLSIYFLKWCGMRNSNSHGDFSVGSASGCCVYQFHQFRMVLEVGFGPTRFSAMVSKTIMSTNSSHSRITH